MARGTNENEAVRNLAMESPIEGVVIQVLTRHRDHRGWLCELFRRDETPADVFPLMAYISATLPGVARGPHEHRDQTDFFGFVGPSDFKLYLWDNRPDSTTRGASVAMVVGESNPCAVLVPPGVVHAYRNVGSTVGLVFNGPNRLYRGEGKKESVDEIRHEDAPGSPFVLG
jgi:dTDP-4-dehydrorhamnose 3,5-epimerase